MPAFILISTLLAVVPFSLLVSGEEIRYGSVLIGGPCTSESECVGIPGTSSKCEVVGGKPYKECVCRDHFVPRKDLGDCLPIVNDENIACEESSQCQLGDLGKLSECTGDVCLCMTTAVKVNGTAECLLKAIVIDDPCLSNLQCSANLGPGGTCYPPGECKCHPLSSVPRPNGTLCLPFVHEIGTFCEEQEQCRQGTPGPLSECSLEHHCRCQQNAVHVIGEHKCLPISYHGDTCENDVQCKTSLGPLSECRPATKKCGCLSGSGVPSSDMSKCIPIAVEIGGTCEVALQCTQGYPGRYSDCLLGQCLCTDEAVTIPGQSVCFKKVDYVGDMCMHDQQCTANLGTLSLCSTSGTCICQKGSVASTDQRSCLPAPILVGQPSEDDNQCSGDSKCSDTNHCTCTYKQVPSTDLTKCLLIVDALGGACEEAKQCHHGKPGYYSTCKLGRCTCTGEALAISGNNKCFRKAKVVEDGCEVTEQCIPNLVLSNCHLQKCICNTGTVPSANNQQCVPIANLDESCFDDGQCANIGSVGSASCQLANPSDDNAGKTCQCNHGFETPSGENNVCYRMATSPGDFCEDSPTFQCTKLTGSRCTAAEDGRKLCLCQTNYVTSGDKKRCLPVVGEIGDPCEEDVQCVNDDVTCIIPPGLDYTQCWCNSEKLIPSKLLPGQCVKVCKCLNPNHVT